MVDKIKKVLKKLEIKNSDCLVLFIDSDILKLPKIKNKEHCENILRAIFEVIGDRGTVVTPSFNYDFCNTGYFDIKKTPSQVGYFSNYLLSKDNSFRSSHPIFSFVSVGSEAKSLMENVSNDAFGFNSVFDRLLNRKAKALYLNIPLINPGCPPSTYTHYIEQKFGVDYRYIKNFPGTVKNDEHISKSNYLFYVRDLDYEIKTDNIKFYNSALKEKIMKVLFA